MTHIFVAVLVCSDRSSFRYYRDFFIFALRPAECCTGHSRGGRKRSQQTKSKMIICCSCPSLVLHKMEEPISRTFLDENRFRLLFQDRMSAQNAIGYLSHNHFLSKSSTPGHFPLKLSCLLKDFLVLFVWICYSW